LLAERRLLEAEVLQARSVEYVLSHNRLEAFTRRAWEIIEPATPLVWNWHLTALCEWLECVTFGLLRDESVLHGEHMGEVVRQLLVNEPPRSMKSILISVMWPCWEWTHAPHLRYLCASYAERLATDLSLTRRRIIESPWYACGMREHWSHPDFALTGDQNVKTAYENTYRGKMIATTFGSTAIGEGGDRVIVDDPQNPADAYSEAKRLTTLRFWDESLSSRLNDKKTGAYVVVMQRLHQRDLTGHVLEEGGWCHVCLPAEAEGACDVTFPRSGRVVHREPGQILWPEREGPAELAMLKRRLGSYGYAGQFQQRPTAAEGGMVKRGWLRYWTRKLTSDDDPAEVVELPEGLTDWRQSWDFGLWGKTRDDYSCGLVGARYGANIYLSEHAVHERLDLPGGMDAVSRLSGLEPRALRKRIENTANGPEVVRKLTSEIPGMIAMPAKGSKEARLAGVSPLIEAGNVFLPHPREAGWVLDFIEELVTFPFAEHDDWVDTFSQLLADFGVSSEFEDELPSGGGKRTYAPKDEERR